MKKSTKNVIKKIHKIRNINYLCNKFNQNTITQ